MKWREGKRVTSESLHAADGYTVYGKGWDKRRAYGLVAYVHCETACVVLFRLGLRMTVFGVTDGMLDGFLVDPWRNEARAFR